MDKDSNIVEPTHAWLRHNMPWLALVALLAELFSLDRPAAGARFDELHG